MASFSVFTRGGLFAWQLEHDGVVVAVSGVDYRSQRDARIGFKDAARLMTAVASVQFQSFSDESLAALWYALRYDDGLEQFYDDASAEAELLVLIEGEAGRRHLDAAALLTLGTGQTL